VVSAMHAVASWSNQPVSSCAVVDWPEHGSVHKAKFHCDQFLVTSS